MSETTKESPAILSPEKEDLLFKFAGVADVERSLDTPEKVAEYRAVLAEKFRLELPEDEGFEEGCERLCREENVTVYVEFWHGAMDGIAYKVGIARDRLLNAEDKGVSMQDSFYAALLCAEAQFRLTEAYGSA